MVCRMNHFMCRAQLPCALLLLAACNSGPSNPDAPLEDYSAQIQRTAFGIPHITAADEKGLGYGAGYAFAQDNVCQLAEEAVTVNGERSRYFGADVMYMPSADGSQVSNFVSDVYLKLLNDDALVAAAWASQPAEIQDLVLGYAHGYNRYLHEVGLAGLPAACRDQAWVRDLSELDLIRVMRRYAVEASGEQFIDSIFAARPPSAHASSPAPLRGAALAAAPAWKRLRPTKGSNGVALGKDATASGQGLLLINPHFPWSGTFRFYQLQLTIPGVVDASGATLAGLPVVALGHNADVAWTHTVNSSWHFALHMLVLDPADPTRYVVDGVSKPMTARTVDVQVLAGDGEAQSVQHTVWMTDLGPVVVMPGLIDWTAQTAFALGDANVDNTRLLQAWWGIDKARSLDDLRHAVETTLGIPWAHTIAVDAAGSAYFGDVTPVPNIPDSLAEACVPPPFQALAATGVMVLDGSTSQCAWQNAQSAIIPATSLPTLTRSDFVQNSNDSAWLTNPAAPLTGYPAIVSIDGQPLNPRTRLGLGQLAKTIGAGTKVTADLLLDFAFSDRAFHAGTLLADLRALCAASTATNLARGCQTLASWDGTASLASIGWPLFREWRRALDNAASENDLDYWTVPFDPNDPIATPRGLRIADPAVATAARGALVSAMATLDAAGVDFTRPWSDLQLATRGDRAIPIHGGGGAQFGDGGDEIYNTINSVPMPDGHLEPYYGSSIIMAVSFDHGIPSARGAMTYSESADPTSPHFADQTDRFSAKDWIRFPFTADEIAHDAELTVTQIAE
jgi:acyl-homoserine-lactone acylase